MDHVELARQLRADEHIHYNCAQAVLAAWADEMGMSREEALRLGTAFGSGMHCGSTCGAVTGALMVLGMTGHDEKHAAALLKKVRENHKALDCPTLLKNAVADGIPRQQHCDGMVLDLVGMLEEMI